MLSKFICEVCFWICDGQIHISSDLVCFQVVFKITPAAFVFVKPSVRFMR